MRQGLRSRNLLGRAPDDHRQLALIMHEFHPRRPTGHPTMTEQGAGTFEKYQRFVLGLERQLLGVIGVVEAERDHRAGFERRQPNDVLGGDDAPVNKLQILAARRLGQRRRSRIMNSAGIRDAGAHHAGASMNGLRRLPKPSISIVTIPPELTRGAGPAAPSASTSPGAKVMKSVTSASNRAAGRIKSAVLAAFIHAPPS